MLVRQHLSGLSLRDLEYALAVADQRHFGRAASQCGVSQPGLSEQIRKLEGLLGTALFERSRNQIKITPKGEVLLEQARVIVRESRSLLEIARSESEMFSAPLHIGVIPTLGPYYIPHILPYLRKEFPNMSLRLHEGQTALLLEKLKHGKLDILILALPVELENLITEPLFFEPFRLMVPKGHPLEGAYPVNPKDLPINDLLLLEEGHCLRTQALSFCSQVSHSERKIRYASSLEMLRHMIAAGEGYSLMPSMAVKQMDYLNGMDKLVHLQDFPKDQQIGRTIGLVWRNTDPRKKHFVKLSEFLRDYTKSKLMFDLPSQLKKHVVNVEKDAVVS
ncbi:LysR substrate-binding domain-containing protein [Entomobacter blattae]|uniref:Hydrogen peroxide-inducible genes activator n=1 Tax=Entomobacter blattae TaxID=2762277 RepID=A0A7H1NPS7_9PROT|nr:LysR substrate-binding domain-containing protein [Entomobacter blattae]QNT77787.1 Hydrogen peroxide-inducible genes activator [Entomobacter blattae]